MQCRNKCGVEISGEEEGGICVTCWSLTDDDEDNYTMSGKLCDDCSIPLIWPYEETLGKCSECIIDTNKMEGRMSKSKTWWEEHGIGSSVKKNAYKPLPPAVECTHEGMPKVFEIGKGSIYASGIRDYSNWDTDKINLIVCLNGHPEPTVRINKQAEYLIKKSGGAKAFPHLKASSSMPYISVDWSDGGVPPISKDFIVSLANFVRAGNNILIHCIGGHGRTGTLLMCLLLREGYTGDVLFWLRNKYCKKAVETARQIDYLRETYGLKTKETPSQTSFVVSSMDGATTSGIVGWD